MTPINPSTSPRAWVIALAKREARDRRSLTPFQREAWREVAKVPSDKPAASWLADVLEAHRSTQGQATGVEAQP